MAVADFDRAGVGARQLRTLLGQLPEVRAAQATCHAFLGQRLSNYPMYGNFPPSGTVRCAALPSPASVYLGDREYFQRAMETRAFSAGDYTIGRTTGRPSVVFAVLDTAGQVEFVISVGLDLGWLNRHLAEVAWPEGTTLTLIDPTPPGRRGSTSQSELDRDSYPPRSRSELSTRTGVGRTMGFARYPVLVGFATSDVGGQAADVHVIFAIPESVAFAAAAQRLAHNLGLLGVVVAVALVAAWVLGNGLIARPVQRVVRATRELQGGNLSARTGLRYSTGEVGQLARAFDSMASDFQMAYLGTVEILADAVEAGDAYTGGHVARVSSYSLAIGRELDWGEKQPMQLQMAAALHDVGKIGVPDAVLNKQGRLDDKELAVMRSHTVIGARLLQDVPFLTPARQYALSHQEFFDGLATRKASRARRSLPRLAWSRSRTRSMP